MATATVTSGLSLWSPAVALVGRPLLTSVRRVRVDLEPRRAGHLHRLAESRRHPYGFADGIGIVRRRRRPHRHADHCRQGDAVSNLGKSQRRCFRWQFCAYAVHRGLPHSARFPLVLWPVGCAWRKRALQVCKPKAPTPCRAGHGPNTLAPSSPRRLGSMVYFPVWLLEYLLHMNTYHVVRAPQVCLGVTKYSAVCLREPGAPAPRALHLLRWRWEIDKPSRRVGPWAGRANPYP